jgi:hypothetical protein
MKLGTFFMDVAFVGDRGHENGIKLMMNGSK